MEDMQTPAPAEPQAIVEAPASEGSPLPPAPPSRMEALEKAFRETDPERPADDRPRQPDGKFAPRQPVEASEVKPEAAKPEAQKIEKGPLSEPPARFSPDAKAAWEAAPEPVKGEIKRAITELERGIAEKDQMIQPLKPFFEMAKQHGVTVHETMAKYVAMEQLLYQNPVKGLEAIAQNMGMTLQDMLAKVAGQPPEQATAAKDREIFALKQQLQQFQGQLGHVTQTIQQQREAAVLDSVTKFAEAHPRFDDLAADITEMLRTGFAKDLADAYAKAERLNPAPQLAAPAAPKAPAQPRPSLSVTGAPSAGSNPGPRPSGNRAEAIARAMNAAGFN